MAPGLRGTPTLMVGAGRHATEVVILPNAEALYQEAAERIARLAERAVTARGRFSWALSGGSTPVPVYRLLADTPFRGRVPWGDVQLFWADERCVAPSHPESNYRLVQESLLEHVPIPGDQIHRILGELGPDAAARAYEVALRAALGPGGVRFDLVSLGVGHDGHVAALFPGAGGLEAPQEFVLATSGRYENRPGDRVSLTLRAINAARCVLFIVLGADKADVVRAVLEDTDPTIPASRVQPADGRLVWLLDRAAAGKRTGAA